MKRIASAFLKAFAFCLLTFQLPRVQAAEPELSQSDLPRTPPVEPASALSTFQLRAGIRLDLVAAEPLIVDPIAMCFDEDSRLFVVEMRDRKSTRLNSSHLVISYAV